VKHRVAGAAALVALFALGSVMAAPSADAHASLRTSEPAAGAQITAAPDEIAITFTEQPEPALSSIRVLDASGAAYEQAKPSPAGGDPLTLRTSVKEMSQGVYTVLWRVVSRVDGHATAGSFAFGVGISPAGAPPPPVAAQPVAPGRSSLEMIGRLLLFAGLISLLGGAGFATLVLAGPAKGRRARDVMDERRDRRLLGFMAGGWVAAAAGVPLFAEAQRRAADAGFADLAATSLGRALIWRGVAVLVAGVAVAAAIFASGAMRRRAIAAGGIAAAVAAFVHVQAGHASATTSPGIQVAGQWIHVLAVSLWVGGFGALLATIRGAATPDKHRAIKRYSTMAGLTLAAVLATGILRSLGELDRFGDLTSTGYGRAVLIKIVVFTALAALGAVNRFRNVARAAATLTPLRRVVKSEAALGVVALVAAAILASLAPPSPARGGATPPPERIVVSGSDFATTARARVAIEPGYAGINTVTASITDYDSGKPIDDAEVSIRFAYLDDTTIPAAVSLLEHRGGGRYSTQTPNLSLDGRWRLTILVQQGSGSVEIPLVVATRCRVTATAAEGQPTLYDAMLPGGRTAQLYADPTQGAKTEVHVTLFDAEGTETFVRSVGVTATRGGADPIGMPHRRFSDGHFIAAGELAPATWRFDIGIATPDGTFKTCFEETIGG